MDKASRVLAEGLPEGMPNTYAALAAHGDVPLSTLHYRARGRRSLEAKAQSQQYLYPYEENALVEFLLHQSTLGRPVRMKHIPSLAFSATRHRPPADRPLKPPGVNWTKGLERRRPELVARKNRPQDWNRYNIYDKVSHWFEVIGKELHDSTVLPENVYNMDETGVMLSMLNSIKVLIGKDDTRGYRGARVKRTMITAVECISADGRCLDPMIIWPASTHRANWTTYPTPGWVYTCSDSRFTNSYISLQWLKLDGFGTHETLEILEFCFENNITLYLFAPLKTAYREQVERMERGVVNTIGKQHFTYLYGPARELALTKRDILAGWRGSGLFLFNPDRVLANIPKPPTQQTILKASKVIAGTCQHYTELPTPVTPVSGEALTSLLDMIKYVSNDEASSQRKERLQQKVSNAAQTFLTKMNDEGKARRSAKSAILGKAKVMTWDDLQKARAEHAVKEAAKAEKKAKKMAREAKKVAKATLQAEDAAIGGGKWGLKRTAAMIGADHSEPRAKVARRNDGWVEKNQVITEPWRAPVARMW
ncbi:DDE-domain-containing protein [Lophiostoma macrostomum CBS 122681]|uniref:DDE-domain-containing protein n=1 Tax=Lophiostoma macrostomum CBS 122681 TaxID=1314788 RepID=A0A6A6SKG8_9PLEO|nr:DDE-domain-containing protein [Lophiostoma macrostomum CBS 122681]